jgi:hypothetical protein
MEKVIKSDHESPARKPAATEGAPADPEDTGRLSDQLLLDSNEGWRPHVRGIVEWGRAPWVRF